MNKLLMLSTCAIFTHLNKILMLFACAIFTHFHLFSEIDHTKLIDYLHDRIDTRSYVITHFCDDHDFEHAYQIGYFTSLCSMLDEIEEGRFDKEVSAPQYPETAKGVNGIRE